MNPIKYLQKVISAEHSERVVALLAVTAGFTLSLGFLILIFANIYCTKSFATEILSISGALVALATFNKVDLNNDKKD